MSRASIPAGKVTAIVGAMPEEVAPLRARLQDARRVPGGHDVVAGRLDGIAVALAVTGDGARNARDGISALFSRVEVDRVIAIGVAGALSADLSEGALVIAAEVLPEGGGPSDVLRADERLIADAARATGARRALVMTANRIADTPAERRRLLDLALSARTPPGPGQDAVSTAVVDLESASYAAAAVRAGIPWIVLRAVSDTADEGLPALLNHSRDAGGAVRRASVVRGLLGDPSVLPVLLGLRRRVQRCAGVLDRAATALLTGARATRDPAASSEGVNHGNGREPAPGSPGGM